MSNKIDITKLYISNKKLYIRYPENIIQRSKYYIQSLYHKLSGDQNIFDNIHTAYCWNNHCYSRSFNKWFSSHQGALLFCFLNNDQYPFNILNKILAIHSILKSNVDVSNMSESDCENIRNIIDPFLNDEQRNIIDDYEVSNELLYGLCMNDFNKDNIMIFFYNNVLQERLDIDELESQFIHGLRNMFFDHLLSYIKETYKNKDDGKEESEIKLLFEPVVVSDINTSDFRIKVSSISSLLGSHSDHILDHLFNFDDIMPYLTYSKHYEILFNYYFKNKDFSKAQNLDVFERLVALYRPLLNRYGLNSHVEPYRSVSFSVIDKITPESYQTLAQKEGIHTNSHLLNDEEYRYYSKGYKIGKMMGLSVTNKE